MTENLSVDDLRRYITTSQEDKNVHKVDKYWIEKLIINVKKTMLSDEDKRKFNNFTSVQIVEKLQFFVEKGLLTKQEVLTLYCDKQEDSRKVIRIHKLNSGTSDCLNDIDTKLEHKYGKNYFDKFNLVDNIQKKPTSTSKKLNLIYINKISDSEYNLVFNYYLKWIEIIGQTFETRVDYTPIVININTNNKLLQFRITKHKGFGKKTELTHSVNSIDDAFYCLKQEILSLLNITEDDLNIFNIKNNVRNLFNNEILTKYEGIHKHIERQTEVEVHFTIPVKSHGIDYTDLDIYKKIENLKLDNSILLIKGSWNMNNAIIKQIFIHPEKIVFDVRKNEIQTLSSYTKSELSYALSHITKNI